MIHGHPSQLASPFVSPHTENSSLPKLQRGTATGKVRRRPSNKVPFERRTKKGARKLQQVEERAPKQEEDLGPTPDTNKWVEKYEEDRNKIIQQYNFRRKNGMDVLEYQEAERKRTQAAEAEPRRPCTRLRTPPCPQT